MDQRYYVRNAQWNQQNSMWLYWNHRPPIRLHTSELISRRVFSISTFSSNKRDKTLESYKQTDFFLNVYFNFRYYAFALHYKINIARRFSNCALVEQLNINSMLYWIFKHREKYETFIASKYLYLCTIPHYIPPYEVNANGTCTWY